uniref:Putative translation initiation factor if-2 n=1 Tax=Amblyomma triste TaxID=251400 RepID=A0A023G556_AMBTT
MRIAVVAIVALVFLCMVALAFAQGGVIGRTCRGPQCGRRLTGGASGYQRLDQSPTSGRAPSPQGQRPQSAHPHRPQGQRPQSGLQPSPQGRRPASGRPRQPSPQGQSPQSGRARLPSSPSSEGLPDDHLGRPGGYQLLEDDYGRPRPLGSPDLHAKRYSGRD